MRKKRGTTAQRKIASEVSERSRRGILLGYSFIDTTRRKLEIASKETRRLYYYEVCGRNSDLITAGLSVYNP